MNAPDTGGTRWRLAVRALELVLADPVGLGGVALVGRAGPARDALLDALNAAVPVRRLGPATELAALDAGVDLVASLAAGRTVQRAGLLDDAAASGPDGPDGPHRASGGARRATLVSGAERLSRTVGARLARWLDDPARAPEPLVLVDERDADAPPEDVADEPPGLVETPLGERVALHASVPVLTLAELRESAMAQPMRRPGRIDGHALPALGATLERELATLARRLGVDSSRALGHAWRAARVAAALDGAAAVQPEHAALAAQLVLAPRALHAPEDVSADTDASGDAPENPSENPGTDSPEDAAREGEASDESGAEPAPPEATAAAPEADGAVGTDLAETLDAAVAVALPAGLLSSLAAARVESRRRGTVAGGGRARGALVATARGRPTRLRTPRTTAERHRLDVAATLRAAVPWQRLRPPAAHGGLALRASDFRVRERRSPPRTTTLFVVDASGSAAMARIGEAKGAVESLLAECYVRRDRVALVSFREVAAHLDLPPTRSLVRARRRLSALPAGGGTPLAAALDLAVSTLARLAREGDRTTCIVMSDGRANVARDGTGGRARATSEALDAARRLGASGARLLWIDTAARPRPDGRAVADAMGARYLPLPQGRDIGANLGAGPASRPRRGATGGAT